MGQGACRNVEVKVPDGAKYIQTKDERARVASCVQNNIVRNLRQTQKKSAQKSTRMHISLDIKAQMSENGCSKIFRVKNLAMKTLIMWQPARQKAKTHMK